MTWALILTIFWYHAPAIATVPGFQTEAACMAAATAWLKINGIGASGGPALCVKQS